MRDTCRHSAVCHDFSGSHDGDNRQKGKAQIINRFTQPAENLTERCALVSAAEDSGQEDHDARRGDPDKGIRLRSRTGVNRNGRFNGAERAVNGGNKLGRNDQEYKNKNKDHRGPYTRAGGNGLRLNIQRIVRIVRLEKFRIHNDYAHDDDGRHHNG